MGYLSDEVTLKRCRVLRAAGFGRCEYRQDIREDRKTGDRDMIGSVERGPVGRECDAIGVIGRQVPSIAVRFRAAR